LGITVLKITDNINKAFPKDWWLGFGIEPESLDSFDYDSISKELGNHVQKSLVEVFELLNISVLRCEYLICENIDDQIELIIQSLNSIPNLMIEDTKIQRLIEINVHDNYRSSIQIALNRYSSFIQGVRHIFALDPKDFIFEHNPVYESLRENPNFVTSSINEINFFFVNLTISGLEFFIEPTEKYLSELLKTIDSLRRDLQRFGSNEFSQTLIEKCEFLAAKWVLRKQHSDPDKTIYYIKDGKVADVHIDHFNNLYLDKWKKVIESHYEINSNWKSLITSDFHNTKTLSNESLSLGELHRRVKYYKDVKPDLIKIKELVEEVERRLNSGNCKPGFEYYIRASCCMYVKNNFFSALLAKHNSSRQEVDNAYDNIKSMQAQTGLKNFFPQYKYLQYNIEYLESIYNNSDLTPLQKLESVKNILEKCEELIKDYKENLKWTSSHFNYLYQLSYEECLIDVTNIKLQKLCLPSALFLPIDIQKENNKFEKIMERFYKLKTRYDVFETLIPDLESLRNTRQGIEGLKNDIQNREVRSMEIIGIFTAIVTFVAASIPTFRYIESAYHAFLFMYALAGSLGIFVFLILALHRGGVGKLKEHKWPLMVIAVLALTAWGLLIYFDSNSSFLKDEMVENQQNITLENETQPYSKLNDSLNIKAKTNEQIK
jgi:hypothetical protein